MPHITRALLRKRAEHNEGMISTLEEITLHQEELEGINEVLGATCRKLKILYLQNNIIPKLQHLTHLKELEYLNMALNNVSKIEGLQSCEFLKKLDLTVNFVDFDHLEESMNNLQHNHNLRDLFMLGNPCEAGWGDDFRSYVIAKLPQLVHLDGTEITKTMRIIAQQKLPELETELRLRAAKVRVEKEEKAKAKAEAVTERGKKKKKESRVVELDENDNEIEVEDASDDEEEEEDGLLDPHEMTENTPEVREEIYRELAQQKREKEERDNANKPRDRDYAKEQEDSLREIRQKEEETEEKEIKQKNEGGWTFTWDEESRPGYLILTVPLPKHLDSSLIDVDVHPTYLSMVIKSKLLRLRLLCEVKSEQSKCQRAKVNGSLVITMPKVNPKENILVANKAGGDNSSKDGKKGTTVLTNAAKDDALARGSKARKGSGITQIKPKKMSLQEQMLAAAMEQSTLDSSKLQALPSAVEGKSGKAVDIKSIVKQKPTSKKDVEDLFSLETKKEDQSVFKSGIEELD